MCISHYGRTIPASSSGASTCPQGIEPIPVAHKPDINHRSIIFSSLNFGSGIAKVSEESLDKLTQLNIES